MIRSAQNARKKPVTTKRGLPVADYFRLYRRVSAGELTWDEAVAQGYCQPVAKGPKRKRKPLAKVKKAKSR